MNDYDLNRSICQRAVKRQVTDCNSETWADRPAASMPEDLRDDIQFILDSGPEAGATRQYREADKLIACCETVAEAFAMAFPNEW